MNQNEHISERNNIEYIILIHLPTNITFSSEQPVPLIQILLNYFKYNYKIYFTLTLILKILFVKTSIS